MKKILSLLLVLSMTVLLFAGCGQKEEATKTENGSTSSSEKENTNDATNEGTSEEKISGEITVLTNRTDVVDTVLKRYAEEFKKKYPDVTDIKFEAITDYEGVTRTRLNTKDYGDVLLIPVISPTEYENFFEPLGSFEDLSKEYNFLTRTTYQDNVYGIPTHGGVNGIVYNKAVFEKAGVTNIPSTPEEFLNALQKIKDETDAIPYYTNYKDGWPLDQWESHVTSVAGDPNYVAVTLASIDDPFSSDEPHYIVYKLLYDMVKNGLTEEDYATTDWETSKQMMAEGKIATMVLGSWAIGQIKELAENPDDIGYLPFPSTKDGKVYASSSGDYAMAISKHSKNKETARKWIEFFVHESGWAEEQQVISTVIGTDLPADLKAFQDAGVIFVQDAATPEGQELKTEDIANEAEIGLWSNEWKQRIVEAAANGNETFDDIMNELNSRWKTAREDLQ